MSRKKIIIILTIVITCSIIFIVGAHILYGKKSYSESEKNEENFGSIAMAESSEEELPDTAEEMDEDDLDLPQINFIGYDKITDLLTISALNKLYPCTREYLDSHGYADIFNITIIEDSIIADRSYPCFQGKLENSSSTLEIRYDISKQMYEFKILASY